MYFILFSNSVKAEIVFVKYLQYCTFFGSSSSSVGGIVGVWSVE